MLSSLQEVGFDLQPRIYEDLLRLDQFDEALHGFQFLDGFAVDLRTGQGGGRLTGEQVGDVSHVTEGRSGQRRQEIRCRLEIDCLRPLHELLEHRLQKRPASLGSSLACK